MYQRNELQLVEPQLICWKPCAVSNVFYENEDVIVRDCLEVTWNHTKPRSSEKAEDNHENISYRVQARTEKGEVEEVKVEWKVSHTSDNTETACPTAKVHGLKPGAYCAFRVQAINSAGLGSFSNWLNVSSRSVFVVQFSL